ncbi:NIPSNAP family containing protein [Mesorhizobium sp. LSJC285A00]|nr:NIPSNAP family containing protein [Mesorhizobium sp. LSJC285A00]
MIILFFGDDTMTVPLNAPAAAKLLASPVVELRQYTLKPGRRETLIDIFDSRFIEGQEHAGMTIIGQFRDLDRPDMFVWLRGFDGMEARKQALTAFYDGPVWTAHRDAANATMIDSDDVLLLKPAWPGAGFDLSGAQRGAMPPDGKLSADNRLTAIVAIQIHHLRSGAEADFAGNFETDAVPVLIGVGGRLLGAFITEHAENSFPRLPVRLSENVFIAVTGFNSPEAHANYEAAVAASPQWQAADVTWRTETLRLTPTSQSLLR